MSGLTNRGKARILNGWYRNANIPATFYLALVTDAVEPTADTNIFSELTEIPSLNGYTTGGIAVARNVTDFDTGATEVDASDYAYIQNKDITWTASGGNLPASGSGARWAVLLDDNVTIANRDVLEFFDLVTNRIVADGQPLTLVNCERRATE
jgi:hypothetical protein